MFVKVIVIKLNKDMMICQKVNNFIYKRYDNKN